MHVLVRVRMALINLQLLNEQTEPAHAQHEYLRLLIEVFEQLGCISFKTRAKFVHQDMTEVLLLETAKLQVLVAMVLPPL